MGFRDEETAKFAKLEAELADKKEELSQAQGELRDLGQANSELRRMIVDYRSPVNKLKAAVFFLCVALAGLVFFGVDKYKAMKDELDTYDEKVEGEFQLRMEVGDELDLCNAQLRRSRNRSAVVYGSRSYPPECVTICPGDDGDSSINVENQNMSCYCEDKVR